MLFKCYSLKKNCIYVNIGLVNKVGKLLLPYTSLVNYNWKTLQLLLVFKPLNTKTAFYITAIVFFFFKTQKKKVRNFIPETKNKIFLWGKNF